jgi:arsenite methyltransferase
MNDLATDCKPCCALLYELPLTTLLLGESFHPGGNRLTRQLAEQALVGPGSRVLDIACGPGNSARLLADEFGATVTGVDYSAALLQTARRQSAAAGLARRVDFLHADAQQLPLAARQFDVVLCECALCTFADAPRALAEMLRVLKPGGRLALSDIVVNAALPESLQSALGQALCIAGARAADEYQRLILAAGFHAPRRHDVSGVLLDTVRQIEQRLRLAEVMATLQQSSLPPAFDNPAEALDSAREFIARGGLGYMLFVARAPRI